MKNPPLRLTIALTYVILVLVTSVLVVYLTFRSGRQDVINIASSLHAQTYSRVEGLVNSLLSTPQSINQLNLSYIHSGVVSLDDLTIFKKHLLSQFTNYPNIVSSEYADENKNDFGPARNLFDAPLSFGETGKNTNFVYRLREIDERGNAQKVLYEETNYDPREKSWYQAAVQADKAIWTPIYLWPNGDVGLDAVVPVKVNGKLKGVLDTAITLKEISNNLRKIKFTPNSQIYILEKSGLLVSGTDVPNPYTQEGDELSRLTATESGVQDLKNVSDYLSAHNLSYSDISGTKRLIISDHTRRFTTVSPYLNSYGLDWLIILSTPESDLLVNLNSVAKTTMIIISLSLIFSILIALILTWYITEPIVKLSRFAKLLAMGNWDQKIDIYRKDEIGNLAETFRAMSSELKQKNISLIEYNSILSSEKQKLEAILKSMADGVCVTDIKQNIVLSNSAFSKMTGLSTTELKNLSLSSFIRKTLFEKQDVEKLTDVTDMLFGDSGGVVYLKSITLRSSDGGTVIVDGVGSRLRDQSGKVVGIVLVIRNVTRQIEFERMKEGFVSLASHQLRTPLTGIKWSISFLKGEKSLSAKAALLIQNISTSTEKMISLVNGLLSVSRLDSQPIKDPRKENLSIKDVVGESLREQDLLLKDKQITVLGLSKIPETTKVLGDKEQLVQLFDNLLNNAATYSEKGKKINIGFVKKDKSVIVSISDQGVGIPKDQHGKVFEKFYRASNVANKIPGTGLGLYYAKQVAENHHGRVWFESEENKGTKFYVELPSIV